MIRPSFSLLSCRKMKINLRQTKNHSAEIDFSFGAEKKCLVCRTISGSIQGTTETGLKDGEIILQFITYYIQETYRTT